MARPSGWISGTSPLDAAAVVPPPELIVELIADLIEFANRSDIDPVTRPPWCTLSSS